MPPARTSAPPTSGATRSRPTRSPTAVSTWGRFSSRWIPARDTPARIGEYAKAIHPDLLGLSGTPEQLDAAAKAYKVYYRRGEGDDDSYLMDHSTFTYLMAPKVGLLAFFRSDASPQAVADAAACNMTALENAS